MKKSLLNLNKKGQFGMVGAGMVTGILFLVIALVIGLVIYSKFVSSIDNTTMNAEELGVLGDIRSYAILGFGLLALGILVAVGSFIMALFVRR